MYKATFFLVPQNYIWGILLEFQSGDKIMALWHIFSLEHLAKYFCFIFLFLGAGGSIVTNFEQLVKGRWKPQADEWLKMS